MRPSRIALVSLYSLSNALIYLLLTGLLLLGLGMSPLATAQVVIDYSYDDLNRLTDVDRGDGPRTTYSYDEVSNITTHQVSNSANYSHVPILPAPLDGDRDKMLDEWERQYGLNPSDPADAHSDYDHDGVVAIEEFLLGTDPTASNTPPEKHSAYSPADTDISGDANGDSPLSSAWAMALLGGVIVRRRWVKQGSGAALVLLIMVLGATPPNARAQAIDELVLYEVTHDTPSTAPVEPAWYQGEAEPVSPKRAKQRLGKHKWNPKKGGKARTRQLQSADTPLLAASVAATDPYVQLAQALENDPRRIYQYVHNNFEYVPYYGALKGPYLTWQERAGNDFDQAALLVELLRAAGYSANYRYGLASVATSDPQSLEDLAAWLGTEPAPDLIVNTLANGGVPLAWYSNRIDFDHVWVEVTIDGNTVSLDPSFKLSTHIAGIDLDAAMGFSEAGLLAAAGGSVSSNAIANLSATGLDAHLTTLSTQLQSYLAQNYANARVDEITGGYQIVEDNSTSLPAALPLAVTPSFSVWAEIPANYIHTVQIQHGGLDESYDIPQIAGRKLSISYTGDSPTIDPPPPGAADFGSVAIGAPGPTYTWGPSNPNSVVIEVTSSLSGTDVNAFAFVSGGGTQSIPANGGSVAVQVQFSGVNQTAGRKNATLTFDYSYQGSPIGSQQVALTGVVEGGRLAHIYIDDVLSASELSPTGDINALVVDIDHPYAANGGTFADQSATFTLDRNGSYVLASGFGGDRRSNLLAERQRQLERLSLQGLADDEPQMLSETLNVMGQTWLQQTQLNDDLLASLSGMRSVYHHRFGITGQKAGYYVDVRAQFVSTSPRIAAAQAGDFQASAFIASAMEHSVLEQTQGADNPAVSTIKIITLNNQSGDRLFEANSASYGSVQGQLSNYSAGDLAYFQAAVNAGHTLILPENGQVGLNQWSGKGYVDYFSAGNAKSLGMVIGGGLQGGEAGMTGAASHTPVIANRPDPKGVGDTVAAVDPVDLASGAYYSDYSDLALGGSGPHGLNFVRSYNSQRAHQNSVGLGRGWTHNYHMALRTHSDVKAALGMSTPFEALPLLVANRTLRHLMAPDQPPLKHWAVGALIADWATEQLLEKSQTLQLGSSAMTFRELPDGSFVSPAGVSAELVRLVNNRFELRQRFGTVLSFNADNKIATISDIRGDNLSFTYSGERLSQVTDTYGRTLTLNYSGERLSGVSDSTGRTVSYGHNGENLSSVTGLASALWQYNYDSLDRMATVIDPLGTTIVDNSYDDYDRVVVQIAPRQGVSSTYYLHYTGLSSSEEDASGDRTTRYFDAQGRVVATENATGHFTRSRYDGQGHTIEVEDPRGNKSTLHYDGQHNLIQVTDALGDSSYLDYDAEQRAIRATNALNHSVETDYDAEHQPIRTRDALANEVLSTYHPTGMLDTLSDARGVQTTFSYNALDQLTSQQTENYPPVDTSYDNRGNLVSLVDQAGATTTFSHESRGLVTTRTDALGYSAQHSYNALGQLVSSTDRNGDISTIDYTVTTKIAALSYPARAATATHPAIAGFNVNFTYDIEDRLQTMVGPQGTTSNSHDKLNRLVAHTDPNGHQVQYAYDAASNLSTLTYPDGKTVSYSYDALNRLSQVRIDWLNATATPSYDAAGRLQGISHFNGSQSDYGYDAADRLTDLNHSTGSGQTLVDYHFSLDANGNRTQAIIDNEAILPTALVDGTQSHSYNATKNRLLSSSGVSANTYSYDDEGQTESVSGDSNVDYRFDSAHRLVAYNGGGQINTYHYDGIGNRLRAQRNGTTTEYLYGAGGNLLAEAGGTGTITRYYIHGLGVMAFVDAATNQLYVYHHDATGHTVAITDANQNIVNKYAYSAYGKILAEDELISQPFTYVGQYGVMREADNLYYMRARYYDADLGRFISEDPIGFAGGINVYAYVGGNPMMLVDPSGLSAQEGTYDIRDHAVYGVLPPPPMLLRFIFGKFVAKGAGKEIGILRDAAKGKGNFGLGSGTRAEADKLGKAWVGDGAKVASDGKTLVSKDGLKQYRPPSYKPRLDKTQANFEQRFSGQQSNRWQSNGHLDITD